MERLLLLSIYLVCTVMVGIYVYIILTYRVWERAIPYL